MPFENAPRERAAEKARARAAELALLIGPLDIPFGGKFEKRAGRNKGNFNEQIDSDTCRGQKSAGITERHARRVTLLRQIKRRLEIVSAGGPGRQTKRNIFRRSAAAHCFNLQRSREKRPVHAALAGGGVGAV